MFMANQNQQNQSGALYNAITAGSKIVGDIVASSDIRVDGTIEGNIQCSGKVVVGEKGLIKGTITCTNAEVQGHIDGRIEAAQTLALRATANIQGDVCTQSLIVEPGALFCGTCQMGKTPASLPQK